MLVILVSFTSCVSQQEIQQTREYYTHLYNKLTKKELLTNNEWAFFIKTTPYNMRTVDWLIRMIGRPDESVDGGSARYYDFLIFRDRCINEYTGNKDDLCVSTSEGRIGDSVYDARRVRNL